MTSPLLAVIILLLVENVVEDAVAQEREARRHVDQWLRCPVLRSAVALLRRRPFRLPVRLQLSRKPPGWLRDEFEKLASLKDRGMPDSET